MSSALNAEPFRILNMSSTLKERITRAMRDAKMRQADLMRACGVSRGAVSQWVKGDTKKLDGDNLTKAARALGVNPHWLATGEGRPHDFRVGEDASLPYISDEFVQKFKRLSADDQARVRIIVDAFLSASH